MAITNSTEVPLTSPMTSFVAFGTIERIACGSTMRVSRRRGGMPGEAAASS